MTESPSKTRASVRQLLAIAAVLGLAYACISTLRFAVPLFNFIFVCMFFAIPFFAIRPVLRLPQRPKLIGFILLVPLLSLSSCSLLFTAAGTSFEPTDPLQTIQVGKSTIRLFRYENGGALGIHGIELEQRRLLVPGLYIVKSVAFFSSAQEATLSVEGPGKVRVHARRNYYSNSYEADQTCTLKPWVYF